MVHPLISLHPVVTDKRLSNVPLVPLTPTSPAGMATTPRCVMQSRPQVPSRRAWDMAPFLTGQPSSWLPHQPHRHRARTGVPHGWRLPLQLHAQELPDPLQQPVWTQEGRAQWTRSYSVVPRVTHGSLLTSTITQPVQSQAHYTTPTPTPSSPPAVAFGVKHLSSLHPSGSQPSTCTCPIFVHSCLPPGLLCLCFLPCFLPVEPPWSSKMRILVGHSLLTNSQGSPVPEESPSSSWSKSLRLSLIIHTLLWVTTYHFQNKLY